MGRWRRGEREGAGEEDPYSAALVRGAGGGVPP